jgi:hypothetical protein
MIKYVYLNYLGEESDLRPCEITKLYIGDLHASAFKLFKILLDHQIISSADETKILSVYSDISQKTLDGRVGIEEIKKMYDQIEIRNKDVEICVLGDTIFDKGFSDYLMIKLVSHMRKEGLNIQIILSNHDWAYLSYKYNIDTPLNYSKNTSYCDGGSSPLLTHEDYIDYLSKQIFIQTSEDDGTLATHTLLHNSASSEEIGYPEVIINLKKILRIGEDNPLTEANEKIKTFLLNLADKKDLSEDEFKIIDSVNKALWYVNKDIEGSFTNELDSSAKIYIHGHYFYKNPSHSLTNKGFKSINLNNSCFKFELEDIKSAEFGKCPLLVK